MKRKDTLAIVTAAAPGQVLERTAADVSFLGRDAGRQVPLPPAAVSPASAPWRPRHCGEPFEPEYLGEPGPSTCSNRSSKLQNANVLQSRVLAMDETSIKAGRKAKGKMRTGWFWPVYGDGDEIVFHFAPSREHRHVRSFLGEFTRHPADRRLRRVCSLCGHPPRAGYPCAVLVPYATRL